MIETHGEIESGDVQPYCDDGAADRDRGDLLRSQPGREHEAEAAYRDAIAAGNSVVWHSLGELLAEQPGREKEAEQAYRAAITAGAEAVPGGTSAWFNLGVLLAEQSGRGAEAEAAYREAITYDGSYARLALGLLLAGQSDRHDESERAFGEVIRLDATGPWREEAMVGIGNLLARRGDIVGARACYQEAMPGLWKQRTAGLVCADTKLPDFFFPALVRFTVAVQRRPWAVRLTKALGTHCRLCKRMNGGGQTPRRDD